MIGIEETRVVVAGDDATGTMSAIDASGGIAPRGVGWPEPGLGGPEVASVGVGPVVLVTGTATYNTNGKYNYGERTSTI